MIVTAQHADHLQRAAEEAIGGALTLEERDGIARALTECASPAPAITAHLALGVLVGVNDDWPVPSRQAALRAYGLGRVAETIR